mmetsp:Transcript_21089/g.66676  ORF Transcript_21089/g.66676 Transcript_21089/m.66676 type:complete len:430 (+) Transcript_21089:256-1545(+)
MCLGSRLRPAVVAALLCSVATDSSVPVAGGAVECWTDGITPGQCCNEIYGHRGNPNCWDAHVHTYETCCGGQPYRAADCPAFIANFGFGALRFRGDAVERCAQRMDAAPGLCNAANATRVSCPACAALSEHLVRYIACVRQEQHGPGAEGVEGSAAVVGGAHYPTVLRPRFRGRDFTLLAPAFDAYVGSQLLSEGVWNRHEARLLTRLLPPGGVAVDAGANIGAFTLPLAQRAGAAGEVHAFEPFRLLFQCLNANVMLNGLANVHTHQLGLGNRTEAVRRRQPDLNIISNPSKMHVAEQVASDFLVRRDPRPGALEAVHVRRLDEVDLGPRGPALVKVDVESMELPLLQGAEATLRRHRPVLYVEDSEVPPDSDGRHRPTRVMRFLDGRGYLAVDLVRSGLADATSTLFVPQERREAVLRRLGDIRWGE